MKKKGRATGLASLAPALLSQWLPYTVACLCAFQDDGGDEGLDFGTTLLIEDSQVP